MTPLCSSTLFTWSLPPGFSATSSFKSGITDFTPFARDHRCSSDARVFEKRCDPPPPRMLFFCSRTSYSCKAMAQVASKGYQIFELTLSRGPKPHLFAHEGSGLSPLSRVHFLFDDFVPPLPIWGTTVPFPFFGVGI